MRPSRWWYAVAALIAVAGFVLAGFLLVKAVDDFPEPVAHGPVGTPLTAAVDQEGLTVFVDDPAFSVVCEATGPSGAPVPLRASSVNESITTGSATWYVALRSEEPSPPGRHTVLCESEDGSLVYAVGPRATVVGFVGALFGAFGAAGGGFVVGCLVAIVVFLLRRSAGRRGV